MSKTTVRDWNTPGPGSCGQWTPIAGLEGMTEGRTQVLDPGTAEYARLIRAHSGAGTASFGGKSHAYPEEVFSVIGRLHDEALDLWLEAGHYASRPPGKVHGPFRSDTGWVVLEVSFPNRAAGCA